MKVFLHLTPLKPLVLLTDVLLKERVRAGRTGVFVAVYIQSLKRLHLLCYFWSIATFFVVPRLVVFLPLLMTIATEVS